METLSPDEAAHQLGIREQPACDAARLVYADWLDDTASAVSCEKCKGIGRWPIQGLPWRERFCGTCSGTGSVSDGRRERAEFIRVQCELAKMPPMGPRQFDPRYLWPEPWESLRRRERELLTDKQVCEWFLLPGFAVSWTKTDGLVGWFSKRAGEDAGDTIRTTVRRGFVDEIRCTLAAFIGEPCGQCNGDGVNPDSDEDDNCGWCNGSGRVGGCAESIFREHPVTRVVPTDRVPLLTNGRHYWQSSAWGVLGSAAEPHSYLPGFIYEKLPTNMFNPPESNAIDALSDVLVDIGRQLAKLPPLERTA